MKNELIIKKRSSYSSITKMQIQANQRFHLTQVMLAHNIGDTNCDEVAEKRNSHLLLVLMYPGTILLESMWGILKTLKVNIPQPSGITLWHIPKVLKFLSLIYLLTLAHCCPIHSS